jgi:hypothetical protein
MTSPAEARRRLSIYQKSDKTKTNTPVSVLVHLHPDFQEPLEYLLDTWNTLQQGWRFVGLRPGRDLERILLTPGAISDDEASELGAAMRSAVGHTEAAGIIIFTEKRLFDEDYYQLFVGGREADEEPPRVGILSLDFLRKMYRHGRDAPVLFRAIASNILFSLGGRLRFGGSQGHAGLHHGFLHEYVRY